MKKMNKKGFTLVEMLVVIAIIAVLVSIIIPTVTASTDKAAAAANAANLRSIKAEYSIATLNGSTSYTPPTVSWATHKKPTSTHCTYSATAGLVVDNTTCTYQGLCIDCWAALAK